MKKINISIALLLCASSMFAKNIVIDNLNETKHINISRTDINRFVFPSLIKTQVSSKEKDLLVTTSGNEMFVKFSPYQEQEEVQVGGKTVTQGTSTIVYNKAKVNEIFVVTENKTYLFILHPEDSESTTVLVTESFKDKVENIKTSLNSDTDYVKEIANNLINNILNNNPIKGYEIVQENKKLNSVYIPQIKADMNVELLTVYKGYKFIIEEYKIENNNNFILSIPDTKNILYSIIDRKDLLVAYTLYYDNRIYKILPNDHARLIVIKYANKDKL